MTKDLTVNEIQSVKKISLKHPMIKQSCQKQILRKLGDFSCDSDIVFLSHKKDTESQSKSKKNFRGSRYRGVSVNGKSWQVFIVIGGKKSYAGGENTQEKAAALYDKLSIIFHGIKVLLIFLYIHRLKPISLIRRNKLKTF